MSKFQSGSLVQNVGLLFRATNWSRVMLSHINQIGATSLWLLDGQQDRWPYSWKINPIVWTYAYKILNSHFLSNCLSRMYTFWYMKVGKIWIGDIIIIHQHNLTYFKMSFLDLFSKPGVMPGQWQSATRNASQLKWFWPSKI